MLRILKAFEATNASSCLPFPLLPSMKPCNNCKHCSVYKVGGGAAQRWQKLSKHSPGSPLTEFEAGISADQTLKKFSL